METLSYEQIFKRYGTLELLGEALDTCFDLHDAGICDEETENRYVKLAHQSFLEIWALWQYFNGGKAGQENYRFTYEAFMDKEVITLSMNKFDGDFTCACGNTSMDSGFYPSDKAGIEMEPIAGNYSTIPKAWEGHFVCAACKQVYLPQEESWRDKWENRQKAYRHDTKEGIEKWVAKHQKDFDHPLLIDEHPKDDWVAYWVLPQKEEL